MQHRVGSTGGFELLRPASAGKPGVTPDRSVLLIHSDRTKTFSIFLCAMILAMCLAACLIEQQSIYLLNIYINNNNYDDVIVQDMQFVTLSYT